VNVTFLPHAKDMDIAEYAFMAGCFLAVCCGMRLIIRVFQFLEGPKPCNLGSAPPTRPWASFLASNLGTPLSLNLWAW